MSNVEPDPSLPPDGPTPVPDRASDDASRAQDSAADCFGDHDVGNPGRCRIQDPINSSLTQNQLDQVLRSLEEWRGDKSERVKALTSLLLEHEQRGALWGPWSKSAGPGRVVVEDVTSETPPRDVWFVGDVHGDLLGLEIALTFINGQAGRDSESRQKIVFLGDLIDDGRESVLVLARVVDIWEQQQDCVTVIVGNHEDALRFDDDTQAFVSDVCPSTLAEELNSGCDDAHRDFVRTVVRCLDRCPVAVFLRDGTFAAHGGVPHSDLLGELHERSDLARVDCMQDFIWTRLHPRARRRLPNRTTRSCELGVENFENFIKRASQLLGHRVERMIRGHDHFRERYNIPQAYDGRVVTVNTMSARLPREVDSGFARAPCVVRWAPDSLVLHRIEVDEQFIEKHSGVQSGGD